MQCCTILHSYTQIQCSTSLRFSNDYNCSLLIHLSNAHCLMIKNSLQEQRLPVIFSCLLLPAPTVSREQLITTSSGTAATSSAIYSSHTLSHLSKPNNLECGKCKGTSGNYPSRTNTITVNTQQ
jgi:hypothetical protein